MIVRSLHNCFLHFRVCGNSHVVVAAPNLDLFASIAKFIRIRKILRITSYLFKDSIAMILFLLHNLFQKETFIVEILLCK